jgi:hypothetical protein
VRSQAALPPLLENREVQVVVGDDRQPWWIHSHQKDGCGHALRKIKKIVSAKFLLYLYPDIIKSSTHKDKCRLFGFALASPL